MNTNEILEWEAQSAAKEDSASPPPSPELSAVHALANDIARQKVRGLLHWITRRERNARPLTTQTIAMRALVSAYTLTPEDTSADWESVSKLCGVSRDAIQKESERLRHHFLES